MTLWNKVQGVDDCASCGRDEKSHVWVCECAKRLAWKDKLLPVDCVCGSPNATLLCPFSASQFRVASWVRSTFSEHEARDVPERSLRMVEEAIELAQACKVDVATVHRLVDYVFSRPIGEPNQELAGCMVTLYALAVALDLDADTEFETELERINRPEVIERCRRRQHEKRAALVAVPRSSSGLEGPKRTNAVPPPRDAGHVETSATRGPECACGRPSMHESGWCGTQCIGSLGVR